MPLEVNITNEQKVNVTLHPVTTTGKPTQVQAGSVTWAAQSGDATVEPADDGLSAFLISSDNPGDTAFLVSADADLGDGVVTISDVVTLKVAGAMAENLGIAADTPVPK